MTYKEKIKGWCNSELCPPAQEIISRIKTETIKEFAERLKKYADEIDIADGGIDTVIYIEDIDDLVKEMTEGE